jgi:hypothetical protein
MSYRTVVVSSFEEYLASEDDSVEYRAAEEIDRQARLSRFPFSVMLQLSFTELDFANRACWQRLGPSDGECNQPHSEYRMCDRTEPHTHVGKWTWHFFVKTSYDFGFCEWYFAESGDRDWFAANVNEINWGEHYPK